MKTKLLFFVTIISLLSGTLQLFVLQTKPNPVFAQTNVPLTQTTRAVPAQATNSVPATTPVQPSTLRNSAREPVSIYNTTGQNPDPFAARPVLFVEPSNPPATNPIVPNSSTPIPTARISSTPIPQPPIPPTPNSSVPNSPTSDELDKLREIYVPANELGAIFESAKDSLLIKRSEFDKLRKQAREVLLAIDREAAKVVSPVDAVLLASDYKIAVADLRAVIEGELEIEILTDDIVAIPLQLDRVSVIEAINIETKKPAALEVKTKTPPIAQSQQRPQAENPNDQTQLLILQGKKKHKIKIVATTPLEIDSTRQRITFRLPYGVKNSLRLAISGDVELKSGASVISRKVEEHAGANNTKSLTTQFELLPNSGNGNRPQTDLTMSLNSHRASTYQAVIAKSIQFAEVTEQYERLHATVSLTEMHQGIANVEFDIPAGFEITDVAAVLLDKWNVEKGGQKDGQKGETKSDRLKLKFREQLSGLTTIHLSAIKVSPLSREKTADWKFPIFNPVNVAANSVVLGLLVEQELEMTDLASDKLYQIDPLTLRNAIPPSVLNTVPGSPLIRLASAWYAPRDQFSVKANFKRPKADCNVETREVLVLADKTPALQIDYVITARMGKIFETIIETPEGWKIASIVSADGKVLEFREAGNEKTAQNKRQIIVQFPYGIIPGETFRFSLSATGNVDGWFTVDNEKKIIYPQFNIIGTTNSQGKIGIKYGGEEDWEIIPVADENLIPLDESVKQNSFPNVTNLTRVPNKPVAAANIYPAAQPIKTVLAYEYLTKPFKLELKLEKLQPRLNVKAASIYSFTPTLLNVNHELWFTAKHASTQRLAFLLPIETSGTPSIEKINDRVLPTTNVGGNNSHATTINPAIGIYRQSEIKETFNSEVEINGKKYRRWEILLSQPQAGLLKFNVNFDMPIEQNTINDFVRHPFKLPVIIAENVAWQSDIIAIQGDEELDLHILTGSKTNDTESSETAKVDGKINVLRPVDVGMLAGMHRQPGKRLIGVYSVTQDGGDVVVMVQKNPLLALVSAVIENVTVTVQLGGSAESGTIYSVSYDICTDGVSVRFMLPKNDEIWSVKLDGQTIKPQRVNDEILIPIQQQLKNNTQTNLQQTQSNNNRLRRIELVYHSKNNSLRNVRLSFPSLSVKRAEGEVVIPARANEYGYEEIIACGIPSPYTVIPVMQTRWVVIPPTGYIVTKIGDKIVTESKKFDPAILKIFNAGVGVIGAVAYSESDWSQYWEWLPTWNIGDIKYFTEATIPKQSASAVYESRQQFARDANEDEEAFKEDASNTFNRSNKAKAKPLEKSDRKNSSGGGKRSSSGMELHEVNSDVSGIAEPVQFDGSTQSAQQVLPSSVIQYSPQSMRRLKSVQPVTVVINHDLGSGTNYSLVGTKGIQEISVKLSRLSGRVLLGCVSYCVVLFIGLLFIKSDYTRKVRFIFVVFVVGTVFVFVPFFDSFAVIFNAAVYASLTTAIIFIITAIFVTIKRKIKKQ
ncbi:MAG: hypothetical protein LBT09_02945 [Planctomycetaceae bacterium]|jgi:hypothetical protein|nr:hypothetical protein [Planctomycetaceae bacterium]